ncbi:cell division protein FtsL [Jeotgalibacillus soli]|uniref:Cell division protein FtsL n=1 Tax=Jeotgalibacillus soli TaxID=889306 RepID=A0A0C2RSP9_9BACL|nr:cell division protein FtsL [Jeotgalibacillus soli]KIL44789.1 cell division protein [Jeotgalibacillus soli]
MTNSARQYQEQHQTKQKKKVKIVRRSASGSSVFTLGEKVLAMLFVAFICFASLQIISVQADIYDVNKDIQDLESTVVVQQNINNDLAIQVSQMSTYERIWEKAKELGLTLNEANVKVVQQP